jgi:excisionase family DNA binding protein
MPIQIQALPERPSGSDAPVFDKLVWSVEDVSRELSISVRHVYKLMASNQIPYCKVGRLVRFSPVKIAEWLQKGGTR